MKIVNNIAVLEDDTHISKWVLESGKLDHDWYFLNHIKPFIPDNGVVLDIGAYIGDHTEFYAKCVGVNGKVYAFEPNPRAYECLEYNMRKHQQVVCVNKPISNVVSEYIVVEPCENIGMAYIEKVDIDLDNIDNLSENDKSKYISYNEALSNNKIITSVVPDNMNFGHIDMIKIDVEGLEIEVLEGCAKILEKYSPTLIIEVNTHTLNRFGLSKEDLFNKVKSLGYKFTNIYNWIDLNGDQFDIVCKK